jgi:hypothetical protein
LCNADVKLGDLLIHEGPALLAQKHAAKVFNADKTYLWVVVESTNEAHEEYGWLKVFGVPTGTIGYFLQPLLQ